VHIKLQNLLLETLLKPTWSTSRDIKRIKSIPKGGQEWSRAVMFY